jgi:hypothetical protein
MLLLLEAAAGLCLTAHYSAGRAECRQVRAVLLSLLGGLFNAGAAGIGVGNRGLEHRY